MARLDITKKLAVLADAAKYDASCASSGAKPRKEPSKPGGIGSITGDGICHSYAPDGRCISLLKLLLTEAYASEHPRVRCVALRFKEQVFAGQLDLDELQVLSLDLEIDIVRQPGAGVMGPGTGHVTCSIRLC